MLQAMKSSASGPASNCIYLPTRDPPAGFRRAVATMEPMSRTTDPVGASLQRIASTVPGAREAADGGLRSTRQRPGGPVRSWRGRWAATDTCRPGGFLSLSAGTGYDADSQRCASRYDVRNVVSDHKRITFERI